jgi:Uma2 family endonuclease
MTAAPLEPPAWWPHRALTVAEYTALGETEFRTELVEGQLLMSPSPSPDHGNAMMALGVALKLACPPGLEIIPDTDLDLQLVAASAPATVRRPDLMVIRSGARRRVREQGGLLVASDVVLVVEIISPGSVRTDRLVKRGEYADAGIPRYWVVDLTAPVSILSCHLAGEFGYADDGEQTGTFRAVEPFPLTLDLATLT